MSYGSTANADNYFTQVPENDPYFEPEPFERTPPNQSLLLALHPCPVVPSPLEHHDGPDWNKDFQDQLKQVLDAEHGGNSESSVEKSVQLRQLCSRFADTASEVATRIIEELHMPTNRRTIIPLSESIGGVAGGEKYVHSGIFFKLSRDWKGIYGGDGNAMKAAEHEIKGGMAYLDCRIVNLRLPLMALIRYRGHCILAESIIPVGADSLVYGSRDGGLSVFADNAELNEKMRLAAKHLNLKAHRVWNREKSKSVVLHAPIDMEGHIGRDGLFYGAQNPSFIRLAAACLMIDTARVFPPVAPVKGSSRGTYLYKLLRPEIVRLNPVPLSSDAYSKFGKDGEVEHNEEILDATIRLEGQVIPEFARYLDYRYSDTRVDGLKDPHGEASHTGFEEDDLAPSLSRSPHRQLEELGHLVAEMHLRGINLRYALAIHSLLSSALISRLILTEVVARSAKHLLDDLWRGLDSLNPEIYRKETAKFFSNMFSFDAAGHEFWSTILSAEVDQRFPVSLRRHKTSDMSLSVTDAISPTTSIQIPVPSSTTDGDSQTTGLRRSNPRNQIRSSTANSLNSDTSTLTSASVDGELLRKGIDPTLLLFRVCQLCGVELDFTAWNLPSPSSLESTSSATSSSSAEESAEGSHDDSLATLWHKVDFFLLLTRRSLSHTSSLNSFGNLPSLNSSQTIPNITSSQLRRDFPIQAIKRITARTKYLNRISFEEGTALSRLALTKSDPKESFELFARANRQFQECLEIKPDDSRALLNWAFALTKQAELVSKDSNISAQLWKEAFSKYDRCMVLRPTDWRALTCFGTALSSQAARASQSKDAIALYRAALDKFDRALKLLPAPHFHTVYNTANARLKLARLQLDDLRAAKTVRADFSEKINRECLDLLSTSITRFQEALEIEGTNVNAMHNLAVALATQARLSATDRDRLYQSAYLVYQRAVHMVPTSADIYYAWGNALFRHALARREAPNSAADDQVILLTLFDAATRYQYAIVISQKEESPFSRDLFINFGNVLMLAAKCAHRLHKPILPPSFLSCCSCYLTLIEQPLLCDTEATVITQVLTSFKRYLPKDTSTSLMAPASPAGESTPNSARKARKSLPLSSSADAINDGNASKTEESSKQPLNTSSSAIPSAATIAAKAEGLLSSLGEHTETDTTTGNVLSGSGESTTSDAMTDSTHPSKKKKSKASGPSTPSASPQAPHTKAEASPTLTKKKSAKSLANDTPSPSPPISTKADAVKSDAKTTSSPSVLASTKKSTPKLDLAKSQPQSPPVTSPHSPTQTDDALSPAMRARPGSTSTRERIKARLGSFFGIRSKSPSLTTASPSNPSLATQTTTAPSSSPPTSPKGTEKAEPMAPSSGIVSSSSSSGNTTAVTTTSPSSSPLAVPTSTKARSKKKPGRSLSYAEEIPRSHSSSTSSTHQAKPSTNDDPDFELLPELSTPRQGRNGRAHLSMQLDAKRLAENRDIEPTLTASGTTMTRTRRKSDADSTLPLRRQATTASISSPRKEKEKQSSALAQSSPALGSAKSIAKSATWSIPPTVTSSSSSPDVNPSHAAQAKKEAKESSAATSSHQTTEAPSLAHSSPSVIAGKTAEEKEERKGKRKSLASAASSKKEKRKSASKTPAVALTKDYSSSKTGKRPRRKSREKISNSSSLVGNSSSPQLNNASSNPSNYLQYSNPILELDWSKKVLYSDEGETDIKESEFIVRGLLGTSRSGLVFVATRMEVDYAMKVRLAETIAVRPKLTPIYQHPFFTKLKCIFFADTKLIMAYQLVRGPPLLDYISKNIAPKALPRLDHLVLRLLAAQLVSAWSYISEVAKTPYRDFKPSNVLLHETGNIILTAHCEEDQSSLAFSRADVSYLAPEVVIKIRERRALASVLGKGAHKLMVLTDDLDNRVEDERASWWTLGMFLYVIATGVNPFVADDASKVEENVLKKNLKPLMPQNMGKLSSLLEGLLDRDITNRLCTPDAVRKHPYFHNMDWNKLFNLGYHPPFLPNAHVLNAPKRTGSSNLSNNGASPSPATTMTLTDSMRSMSSNKGLSFSLNSSSLDTSLDLSSTAGQIALMNTMVMPDVSNELEGNAMFIQNTSMVENQLCASSSDSDDNEQFGKRSQDDAKKHEEIL